MRDLRRINVAVTRARDALYIIGAKWVRVRVRVLRRSGFGLGSGQGQV